MSPDTSAATSRLGALERRVRAEQALGDTGVEPWARATDAGAHTVVIVGAGQAGLVVAAGLRSKGVADVLVVDAGEEGGAGPWPTFARMRTLRTPKRVAWPAWGVPAASPQAWFRAVHGDDAWDGLEQFPTAAWHAFLEWYRRTLDLPVRFGTTVRRIAEAPDGRLDVTLDERGAARVVRADRVVLATGIEGAGGIRVPGGLFDGLPRALWAHTHEPIDFARLRGARIGVLGGGTGAFDNAATALEAGARSVTVHMRRPAMPDVSPYRWMEFPGILEHYAAFDDDQKWRFNEHLTAIDQPATQGAVWRAYAWPGFEFRTSSAWLSAEARDGGVEVQTTRGPERYDFVIAATGIAVDLAMRPELATLEPRIARWRDRYRPAEPTRHPELLDYPYLGDDFALQPVDGSPASALRRVHLFNHGARMSLGVLSHQISGLLGGAERVVRGVVAGLVRDRSDALLRSYLDYDTPVGVQLGPRPGERTAGVPAEAPIVAPAAAPAVAPAERMSA
ncbi:NAD(P)-binding domain-containing protein [Microbacterium sp. No. 7]|uniref:NAD(P)-binding domain-containing protein n=1 Tax=Microbacterium sp. No. 7 TaxID=1714373 RepID=UPI0006D043DF|nr:NAD(P)/FAD-dependent oxidoreductase [Microbacterium sp. No. 7]